MIPARALPGKPTMTTLRGSRTLITGASSGIGAAAAELFAQEGSDLALLARGREGLEVVAERARRHGVQVLVLPADLADRAAVEAAVQEAVDVLGGLDVLVSNAAAMVFGDFVDVPPEDFERTVAVTFLGAVNVIRASLPHLERTAGTVVVTGSIMARVPLPNFSSYAASKHALRGFLNTLRIELAESGSRVQIATVHPGAVATPLWENISSVNGRRARHPPDRYTAEAIARALVAQAERPRFEITVGLEARVIELGYAVARPVAEPVLRLVSRYYRSGHEPAEQPGGLWESQGDGRPGSGWGRPSLLGLLRLRLRR